MIFLYCLASNSGMKIVGIIRGWGRRDRYSRSSKQERKGTSENGVELINNSAIE